MEGFDQQVYLFEDARVVALHLGLEAGGGFEVGELGGVSANVTGDLAAGWSGAHTGQISLGVCQTLQRNTHTPALDLWFTSPKMTSQLRFELTDSLSEAEERRDFPLLCRLNWLLMLEVWLDTVERRVDMKLLLVERRSR